MRFSTSLLSFSLLSVVLASANSSTTSSPTPVESSTALSSLVNGALATEGKSLKKRTLCVYFGTCTYLYGSGYYSGYGSTSYYSYYNTQTDVNNCGWDGNVCPSNYANGGAGVCVAGVCQTTCNNLFDFNYNTASCQDVSSNVQACGACGSACALSGAASATCYIGVCYAQSCIAGYTFSNYACTANFNTQTDVNNCGAKGKVCAKSYAFGTGSICSAGICQPSSCNSGYAFNTATGVCQNILTDSNNCGSIGKVCASGSCVAGVCPSVPCLSTQTRINGVCVATVINLSTDVNNCGYKGNVCPKSYAYGGVGLCQSGLCTTQCTSGFSFNFNTGQCQDTSSDLENCGYCGSQCAVLGASTAVCSAGTCYATSCQPGYRYANYACTASVNVANDVNNCGTFQHTCETSYQYGTGSICSAGVCQPVSCHTGYAFNTATHLCIPTTTDSSNCGSVRNVCSFSHGLGSCVAGVCTTSSCSSGYSLVNGVCTLLNTVTDSNNCGSAGNICSFPNGLGSCVASKCTISSCNSGFSLINGVCTSINTATDVKNCGALGKVCPASYANGGASTCSNSVCSTTCNTGFAFDTSAGYCRDITSDVNHCGSLSTVCSALNGVAQCKNSVCSIASCATGYALVSGVCTAINTTSDVKNCGAIGKACPTSYLYGSGVQCVASVCQTTCAANFGFDYSAQICRGTSSDSSNCGRVGNVCQFANAVGSCLSSVCTISKCNTGFQLVNNVCVSMDVTSDVNNCGAVGKICSFPNGVGKCSSSVCTFTSCATGYLLASNTCSKVDTTSDAKNCGSIGLVCPAAYVNGGSGICVNSLCTTTCNTGFAFDSSVGNNICRDITSDTKNCGKVGNLCTSTNGIAQCKAGVCSTASCNFGFNLVNGVCAGIDITSDLNNCGQIGRICAFTPSGATGICSKSVCTATSCPAGYFVSYGACAKITASQQPRMKRDVTAKTLCPSGETACPILGSASYEMALAHHFSAAAQDYSGIMSQGGGYECLDTTASLESCGGCASTGEGTDCTAIRGANGVGCEAGTCIILSCSTGFKKGLDGSRCLRIHNSASNRSTTGRRDHIARGSIGHHRSH